MKTLFSLMILTMSFQAFSQDPLSRCEARNQKLQEKISELSVDLARCERNSGNSSEIYVLRSENARLADENRRLQIRIDQLEGRGYEQFYCAAGCKSYTGSIDTRYISGGTAYTQLEADFLAKQGTQKKYSCNYGVATYKCESFVSEVPSSFCTAGCVDYTGRVDERYSSGARGRNRVEAEVLALQDAQKKHSCNYGVKVISCN